MFRTMAVMTLVLMGTAASATITAGHYLWESGALPDSGEAFVSYRVWVDVSSSPGVPGEDDWTAAWLDAELTGGIFYQNTDVGANPPNPAYFESYPDAEYDTYYTSPGDYPNRDYDGAIVGIAGYDSPTTLWTGWFDTIDTGNGNFVIAQFTVLPAESDWILTGHLEYAARHTAGELFYHYFTIPEPATLSLLGLGVLAGVRRRGG